MWTKRYVGKSQWLPVVSLVTMGQLVAIVLMRKYHLNSEEQVKNLKKHEKEDQSK